MTATLLTSEQLSSVAEKLPEWTLADQRLRAEPERRFETEAALSRNDPAREAMEVRCMVLWAPEELAGRATLRGVASNVGEGKRGPSGHDNDVYRASS